MCQVSFVCNKTNSLVAKENEEKKTRQEKTNSCGTGESLSCFIRQCVGSAEQR